MRVKLKGHIKNSPYAGSPRWQLLDIIAELESRLRMKNVEIERLHKLIDFIENEKGGQHG